MTLQLELGWSFGQIEFTKVDFLFIFLRSSLIFEIFLQIAYLFFKIIDFFLEREDRFPFHLESVALRIDICERHVDLL